MKSKTSKTLPVETEQSLPKVSKPPKLIHLTCISECRIVDPETKRVELYEDGFGYIYTVSEVKAKVLLATGCFREEPAKVK